MGLMFAAAFAASAQTTSIDLFEIVAPSTGPVVIHRCIITQSSDYGDAQAEIIPIAIRRGATSAGAGSAITPIDLGTTGATFSGTVLGAGTKASGGTPLTTHVEGWNVAQAFDYLPTPETRFWVPASARGCVELTVAPVDSLTISGTLIFEQV